MSMMNDNNEKNHNDIYDLILDSCQQKVRKKDAAGNEVVELELDEKRAWYKTLTVNSPHFGRFAKCLEDLDNLAIEAFNFMPSSRAKVLSHQIRTQVNSYKYSMDGKSSETLRDKHNTQPSLLDRLMKNKVERSITLKEEAGRSLKDSLLGKEKKDAADSY